MLSVRGIYENGQVRLLEPVPHKKQAKVIVTAGKRACPPEDVGGVCGYADFLEAVKDPEHEDMLEWAGGEFDPDEFDPDEINYTMYNIILLQEIFHVDLFHIIR